MSIGIVERGRNCSHSKYDVVFHSETIHTTVTHIPYIVDDWLSNFPRFSSNLVGLDVEWLPNRHRDMDNPVAVLQLCIDRTCLVFQIHRASRVPESLVAFLDYQSNTFVGVGVGIEDDVEKLCRDYSLRVRSFIELRTLAARSLGEQEMSRAGLKTLALHVLGKDIEKPRWVTMSRWNNRRLTAEQVQYACIDAFASFEIARILYARMELIS